MVLRRDNPDLVSIVIPRSGFVVNVRRGGGEAVFVTVVSGCEAALRGDRRDNPDLVSIVSREAASW